MTPHRELPMNRALALVAILLTAAAACNGEPPLPLCEGDPPPSVVVTLTDPDGSPIPQPVVTHAVDGAPAAPCGAVDDPPTRFICGENVAGSFVISASGYGFEPAVAELEVVRDACFVVSQELPIVLEPSNCPDRSPVSVTVTVIDQGTAAIQGAEVAYLPTASDWTEPAPCDKREPRTFWCGESQAGPIRLITTAPGYRTDDRTVTVREDFCGMIPESATVILYP